MEPPPFEIVCAMVKPESETSHKATVAPALQKTSQIPLPIPLAPPEIIANCPSKFIILEILDIY